MRASVCDYFQQRGERGGASDAVERLYDTGLSDLLRHVFGKGAGTLEEKVKTDVKKRSATQQGDWLPLVFILTDEKLSDRLAYQEIARRICGGQIPELNPGNIIACAAGGKADPEALKILTDNVAILNNLSAEEIA